MTRRVQSSALLGVERNETMKAWLCNTKDGSFPSIVFAETRGRARYLMAQSAADANYQYTYADMNARRATEYDWIAEKRGSELRPRCYLPPLELARDLRIHAPDDVVIEAIRNA